MCVNIFLSDIQPQSRKKWGRFGNKIPFVLEPVVFSFQIMDKKVAGNV